jgi:hypothetical protein
LPLVPRRKDKTTPCAYVCFVHVVFRTPWLGLSLLLENCRRIIAHSGPCGTLNACKYCNARRPVLTSNGPRHETTGKHSWSDADGENPLGRGKSRLFFRAIRERLPREVIVRVLKAVNLNRRRQPPPFDVAAQTA